MFTLIECHVKIQASQKNIYIYFPVGQESYHHHWNIQEIKAIRKVVIAENINFINAIKHKLGGYNKSFLMPKILFCSN